MKVDASRILASRIAERRALVDRAARFAAAVGLEPEVLGVVVFGSVARGDFNLWSDVDVLVVVEAVDASLVERVRTAGGKIGLVQPVIWSRHELCRRLGRRDPIAVESVEHGIWLAGAAADVL